MKTNARTEGQVLATLDRLNEAFLNKSVEGVLELFARDPDILIAGSEEGEIAVGPRQLKALLEGIFSRPQTLSWKWKWHRVSTLGSLAWIFVDAMVQVEEAGRVSSSPYRMSIVLVRRSGRWLWVQYHGSEPVRRL